MGLAIEQLRGGRLDFCVIKTYGVLQCHMDEVVADCLCFNKIRGHPLDISRQAPVKKLIWTGTVKRAWLEFCCRFFDFFRK